MLCKKMKIGGLILSLLLMGCGSSPPVPRSAPVEPVPVLPTPPPKVTKTLSGDGWQIEVPQDMELKFRGDDILFVGHDVKNDRIFSLYRGEVSDGISASMLAALIKAKFANSGFEVQSQNQGMINGVPFVYLSGTRPASLPSRPDPVVVNNWILVKSSWGYVFTCGGKLTNAAEHLIACNKSAVSLKLK